MNFSCAMKLVALLSAIMVLLASVSCAPNYNAEYDNNLREILGALVQKDGNIEERLAGIEDHLGLHQVSRKSSRSPQLRLRFGKRPDTTFPPENNNVQLRLRYGKRSDSTISDSVEIPAFLGAPNDLDN